MVETKVSMVIHGFRAGKNTILSDRNQVHTKYAILAGCR